MFHKQRLRSVLLYNMLVCTADSSDRLNEAVFFRQRCAHRRSAEPNRHCCSTLRRTDPANAQKNIKNLFIKNMFFTRLPMIYDHLSPVSALAVRSAHVLHDVCAHATTPANRAATLPKRTITSLMCASTTCALLRNVVARFTPLRTCTRPAHSSPHARTYRTSQATRSLE